MVRGATVRGPTTPVDALPSAPRTAVGGVVASVLALLGLAALAYPAFGLAVGAAAVVTVVALRRRDTPSARSASSAALTARERAGDRKPAADEGAADTTASARCEPAD